MVEFPTFKGLCDLDLGSDRTAYHHASLVGIYHSTYIPNFIEIEETFRLLLTANFKVT